MNGAEAGLHSQSGSWFTCMRASSWGRGKGERPHLPGGKVDGSTSREEAQGKGAVYWRRRDREVTHDESPRPRRLPEVSREEQGEPVLRLAHRGGGTLLSVSRSVATGDTRLVSGPRARSAGPVRLAKTFFDLPSSGLQSRTSERGKGKG